MAKLNPYARALKQIRKKELADRLKSKKAGIEKSKAAHKAAAAKRKSTAKPATSKKVAKK